MNSDYSDRLLALPSYFVQLKSSGYKIVQVKAKEPVQTLAEYDQQLEKELGGGTANSPSNTERGANDKRMTTAPLAGLGERMKNGRVFYPRVLHRPQRNAYSWRIDRHGAVGELVGIDGGVVSGVINLELSGVEASDWRPRHDERYHEA